MQLKKVEKTYQNILPTIKILQKQLDISYIDALIETLDNVYQNQVHVEDGLPNEVTQKELQKYYSMINLKELSSEEIRNVIQLTLLQVYREEKIQANYQMTPDSIGIIVTYLVKLLVSGNIDSLLDITVGTGNLLETVVNNLEEYNIQIANVYGVDNDDTMLSLANISSLLQRLDMNLIHQDALGNELATPQTQVVIGDLPVGYYPLDERVQNYQLSEEKGHSLVHVLFIERALQALKEDGYAFLIVPAKLLQTAKSMEILKCIQSQGYLQGYLNLPEKIFTDEKSRKSLLIMQKKGKIAKQAKQVLLANIPEFKNKSELKSFTRQILDWKSNNLD